MSTPKPPDGLDLPTFFIDRDLGRIAFPTGLRAAGLVLVTIAEHYGIQASEQVEDEVDVRGGSRRPGPFVHRVHPDRIEALRLADEGLPRRTSPSRPAQER